METLVCLSPFRMPRTPLWSARLAVRRYRRSGAKEFVRAADECLGSRPRLQPFPRPAAATICAS